MRQHSSDSTRVKRHSGYRQQQFSKFSGTPRYGGIGGVHLTYDDDGDWSDDLSTRQAKSAVDLIGGGEGEGGVLDQSDEITQDLLDERLPSISVSHTDGAVVYKHQ